LYDEVGNPIDLHAQDASQTTWVRGAQNLPLEVNYVDSYTQTPMTNAFTYENCNNGNNARPVLPSKKIHYNPDGKIGKSIFMIPQFEAIKKLRKL